MQVQVLSSPPKLRFQKAWAGWYSKSVNRHLANLRLNPTAGPASAPWSNGRGGNSPSSQPAAGVSPTPPPSCLADLYNDCFGLCNGVSDLGDPGPICNWLFSAAAGASGGSATFTSGAVTLNCPSETEIPAISRTLPAPIPSVFDLTLQWFFTKLDNNATQQMDLTSQDGSEEIYIQIQPDGLLIVLVGNVNAQDRYNGTWPAANGAHKLVLFVDGAGVPSLTIDGVAIPLTFDSTSTGGGFDNNSMTFVLVPFLNQPCAFSVQKIFVATGDKRAIDFCCPT